MKLLSVIKSHKVASVLCAALVIGSTTTVAALQMNQIAKVYEPSKANVEKIVELKDEEVGTAEPAQETAQAPTVQQETVPTPEVPVETTPPVQVLSSVEYAQKYLNVSDQIQLECFNRLVAKWPERFTDSVREANVKALRVFTAPCATGITSSAQGTSVIEQYGRNGEFFDSAAANVGRNQ